MGIVGCIGSSWKPSWAPLGRLGAILGDKLPSDTSRGALPRRGSGKPLPEEEEWGLEE